MSDNDMREANPHLTHIIGKNMEQLKAMFPLADVCTDNTCVMDDLDHGIFMEYEHDRVMAEKKGMIRVMYNIIDVDLKSTKTFHWYDGEDWVELSQ